MPSTPGPRFPGSAVSGSSHGERTKGTGTRQASPAGVGVWCQWWDRTALLSTSGIPRGGSQSLVQGQEGGRSAGSPVWEEQIWTWASQLVYKGGGAGGRGVFFKIRKDNKDLIFRSHNDTLSSFS